MEKLFKKLPILLLLIGLALVGCDNKKNDVVPNVDIKIKSATNSFEIIEKETLELTAEVSVDNVFSYVWYIDDIEYPTEQGLTFKLPVLPLGAHKITFKAYKDSFSKEETVIVTVIKNPFLLIDFEDAGLNDKGILREKTKIGTDDSELGNFWIAYEKEGIVFRSYVSTEWSFWCGYTISNNNDTVTPGPQNDCSVYSKGGKSGKNFAVCCDGGSAMGPEYTTELYVADSTNKEFEYCYVTNSTYATLAMKNGASPARALTYEKKDWFKLTIVGVDASGKETAKVDFLLADFTNPTAKGIVTDWTKVNLKPLGKVQKMQFKITGSDMGGFGLNTPAYFCIDDIKVKRQ